MFFGERLNINNTKQYILGIFACDRQEKLNLTLYLSRYVIYINFAECEEEVNTEDH